MIHSTETYRKGGFPVSAQSSAVVKPKKQLGFWRQVWRQKQLVILSLPVIFVILFNYVPLWGWLVAFFNYKPTTGFNVFANEFRGLEGGFPAREGHAAAPPEEGLLVDGHAQDLRRVGQCARSGLDRVGVGAVETAEIAALEENDEPESRPVECSHGFVRMYTKHDCSLFLNKGVRAQTGFRYANPAPAPKSGFSSRYILSWKLRLMTSSWCSRLNLVKFTA